MLMHAGVFFVSHFKTTTLNKPKIKVNKSATEM